MDKTKSSLEKFLENYLKNKRITNSADSFDEYRAKNAHDYDGEYARGVESAYVKSMKANADYGAKAERIFSSGLSGSGYAERQRQLSGEGYQKQLEELLGERSSAHESTVRGYADYLEDYGKRQGSLMKTVRSELIKNGILNEEKAYEYALGAGLTDERAREVSAGLYSALKDKIVADLIDKVITFRLDPDGAAELARKYGLNEEDTEYVRQEAERLRGESITPSDDALRELEKKADKATTTFG